MGARSRNKQGSLVDRQEGGIWEYSDPFWNIMSRLNLRSWWRRPPAPPPRISSLIYPHPSVQGQKTIFAGEGPHRVEVHFLDAGETEH